MGNEIGGMVELLEVIRILNKNLKATPKVPGVTRMLIFNKSLMFSKKVY